MLECRHNIENVPGGKMDLPKGACFKEFYYRGLYCETSEELLEYLKKNKWYFDKMRPEVQQQFRDIYKDLKRREKEARNETRLK